MLDERRTYPSTLSASLRCLMASPREPPSKPTPTNVTFCQCMVFRIEDEGWRMEDRKTAINSPLILILIVIFILIATHSATIKRKIVGGGSKGDFCASSKG